MRLTITVGAGDALRAGHVPDELRKAMAEIGEVTGPLGEALWVAQGAQLAKGAGHKYIKRVRGPNGKWRYFYTVAHGGRLGADEDLHVGAKFAITDGGQRGHFEITASDGDHVTIRHDETGRTQRVTKQALASMLRAHHATAIDAHRARLERDAAAAAKHGTVKQRARIAAEAARHGHTADKPDRTGPRAVHLQTTNKAITNSEYRRTHAEWRVQVGEGAAARTVSGGRADKPLDIKIIVPAGVPVHADVQGGGRTTWSADEIAAMPDATRDGAHDLTGGGGRGGGGDAPSSKRGSGSAGATFVDEFRRNGRDDQRAGPGTVVRAPNAAKPGGGPGGAYYVVLASKMNRPNEDNQRFTWTEQMTLRAATDEEAAPHHAYQQAIDERKRLVAEVPEAIKQGHDPAKGDPRLAGDLPPGGKTVTLGARAGGSESIYYTNDRAFYTRSSYDDFARWEAPLTPALRADIEAMQAPAPPMPASVAVGPVAQAPQAKPPSAAPISPGDGPKLQGSPKQVEWAERIRAKKRKPVIAAFDELMETVSAGEWPQGRPPVDEMDPEVRTAWERMNRFRAALDSDQASVWIDAKDDPAGYIADALLDAAMSGLIARRRGAEAFLRSAGLLDRFGRVIDPSSPAALPAPQAKPASPAPSTAPSRPAGAVRGERVGRKVFATGETYRNKDALRALGFKWDPAQRAWWVPSSNWENVRGQVEMMKSIDGPSVRFVLTARPWVEVPAFIGAVLLKHQDADLTKGAGHKYIRKVPDGKGGWRYFYTVTGGKGIGHEDEMQHGAAFRLHHGGQAGHFHVTGAEGSKVRIKHDESGHEQWVEKKALTSMLHREHAEKISAHVERTKRYVDAAHTHGSAKQRARARAHAERYGHTRHLAAQGQPKDAAPTGDIDGLPKGVRPGDYVRIGAHSLSQGIASAPSRFSRKIAKVLPDGKLEVAGIGVVSVASAQRMGAKSFLRVDADAARAEIAPDKGNQRRENAKRVLTQLHDSAAYYAHADGLPVEVRARRDAVKDELNAAVSDLRKYAAGYEVTRSIGNAGPEREAAKAAGARAKALIEHIKDGTSLPGEENGKPKRATPDQITGDELEQRREAARKSAEKRRKAPEPEAVTRVKNQDDYKAEVRSWLTDPDATERRLSGPTGLTGVEDLEARVTRAEGLADIAKDPRSRFGLTEPSSEAVQEVAATHVNEARAALRAHLAPIRARVEELTALGDPGWDSVRHTIEREFGRENTPRNLARFDVTDKTRDAAIDRLHAKLSGQATRDGYDEGMLRDVKREIAKRATQAQRADDPSTGRTKAQDALHEIAAQEDSPEWRDAFGRVLDYFKQHGKFPDDAAAMAPARGATLADVYAYQAQAALDGTKGGRAAVDALLRRGEPEAFPALAGAPKAVLRQLLGRDDDVGRAAEAATAHEKWARDLAPSEKPSGRGQTVADRAAAAQPSTKRATPDQITGDEIEQRREAARKSADARRKAPEPETAKPTRTPEPEPVKPARTPEEAAARDRGANNMLGYIANSRSKAKAEHARAMLDWHLGGQEGPEPPISSDLRQELTGPRGGVAAISQFSRDMRDRLETPRFDSKRRLDVGTAVVTTEGGSHKVVFAHKLGEQDFRAAATEARAAGGYYKRGKGFIMPDREKAEALARKFSQSHDPDKKRAAPDQITGDELEQRREAARKSADARRKAPEPEAGATSSTDPGPTPRPAVAALDPKLSPTIRRNFDEANDAISKFADAIDAHHAKPSPDALARAKAKAQTLLATYRRKGPAVRNWRSPLSQLHRDGERSLQAAYDAAQKHSEARSDRPFDRNAFDAHKGDAMREITHHLSSALSGGAATVPLSSELRSTFGTPDLETVARAVVASEDGGGRPGRHAAMALGLKSKHRSSPESHYGAPIDLSDIPLRTLQAAAASDSPSKRAATVEIEARKRAAEALGKDLAQMSPAYDGFDINGTSAVKLAAGLAKLRQRGEGASPEAVVRRQSLKVLGVDPDTVGADGKPDPVWGQETVEVNGRRFRRGGAVGSSTWREIDERGNEIHGNQLKRDEVEALGKVTRPTTSDKDPGRETRERLTAGAGGAGQITKHVVALAVGHGPKITGSDGREMTPRDLALAAEALHAQGRTSTLPWHELMGDQHLNEIAKTTTPSEAPTFHAEKAARDIAGRHKWDGTTDTVVVQARGEHNEAVPTPTKASVSGNLAVHKAAKGPGWVVSHVPTGLGLSILADTKGAAEHIAGDILRRHGGAIPSDPDKAVKALKEHIVEVKQMASDGLYDRAAQVSRGVVDKHLAALRDLAEMGKAPPSATPDFSVKPVVKDGDTAHKRALEVASRDDSRPNLKGVFHTADGRAIATDGHRLVVMPSATPAEWKGSIRDKDGEHIDANYPNIQQVVPKSTEHNVVVDAARLKQAMDAMHTIGRGQSPITLHTEDGRLKATMHHVQYADRHLGDATSVDLGPAQGAKISTVVHPNYLRDAANTSGGVRIGFNSRNAPLVIDHQDGEKHVVMPRQS